METASPATSARNFSLDSPPPRPPAGSQGGFMPPSPPDRGIGDLANSPHLMTMQGLQMMKDGAQLIANGLPEMAQLLTNSIMDLEQMVAQAAAASIAGQSPAITPPPGVAPMMTPPPGGPSSMQPGMMAGQGPGPFPGR